MVDSVRAKCLVKWFNSDKGYGFLVAEGYNRDIFVHRQQMVRSGVQALTEGETVSCVVQDGAKGMFATQLSKEPDANRPHKD
jgi:CspA family cold shock protein